MLKAIESRGPDATGIAYWANVNEPDHPRHGQRWPHLINRPVPARIFTAQVASAIDHAAQGGVAIGHTRLPTLGSPTNPQNNHPIRTHGVTGVHNGMLWNDDDIFRDIAVPRIAQVDSEAIFALIADSVANTEPDSAARIDALRNALEKIDGSMAVAFFLDDEPDVCYLARGNSSPLVTRTYPDGPRLFASTVAALDDAHRVLALGDAPPPTIHQPGVLLRWGPAADDAFTFEPSATPARHTFVRTAYGWDYDDFHAASTPTPKPSSKPLVPHCYSKSQQFLVADIDAMDVHISDAISDPDLWETLDLIGLPDLVGCYDRSDQAQILSLLAPNLFFPPNFSSTEGLSVIQPFLRSVVDYVKDWYHSTIDRRPASSVEGYLERALVGYLPGDAVRVSPRLGETKINGWIAAFPADVDHQPKFVVAYSERGDIRLGLFGHYEIEKIDDARTKARCARRVTNLMDRALAEILTERSRLRYPLESMDWIDFDVTPDLTLIDDPQPIATDHVLALDL